MVEGRKARALIRDIEFSEFYLALDFRHPPRLASLKSAITLQIDWPQSDCLAWDAAWRWSFLFDHEGGVTLAHLGDDTVDWDDDL